MCSAPTLYDWEAIERDYATNQLTLRELAQKYGCDPSAISVRARRKHWNRSLGPVVSQQVADRLILKEKRLTHKQNERIAIEMAVEERITIIMRHRGISKKGEELVQMLMVELQEAIERRDEIEQSIEEETAGDRDGKRRAMMLRAVGLPSRAATLDRLATAMTRFIDGERKAYNMDDAPEKPADPDASKRREEMRQELAGLLAAKARDVTPHDPAAPIPAIIDQTGKPV